MSLKIISFGPGAQDGILFTDECGYHCQSGREKIECFYQVLNSNDVSKIDDSLNKVFKMKDL